MWKNLKFSVKTVILVSVLVIFMALIAVSYHKLFDNIREMAIKQSTDTMLDGYKNELKDIVDVMALSLASAVEGINDEGEIHDVFTQNVQNARFFPDQSGYFFIYKLGGKVFVHAAQPKLEGRTLLLLKDADGKPLIQELESASRAGGGFVDYWWEKPGKGMLPKLSYARMIPGSPYWIGTGVYIDDVQKKKETISQTIDKFSVSYLRKLYITLVIAFIVLVVPLTLILIRSIVQPLTNLTLIADKFSRGRMNLDIPDQDRRDEIGKLAKALERLGTSTRLAMQRLSKLRKTASNRKGKVNPEHAA